MQQSDLPEAFRRLRDAAQNWMTPLVVDLARKGATPYEILLAAHLSSRTLDTVTMLIAPRLFKLANTPEKMIRLKEKEIEGVIHGVAFSETKAKQILAVSKILLESYGGRVPQEIDQLDELPGIGRKIANLVATQAFGKPGICVDTHVHRIVNRWDYVKTKTPDETEMVLREKLPREYWIEINGLLVALGQNICHATSPKCSICPVRDFCERVGVTRSR